MFKKIVPWFPVFIWMGIIYYLSDQPQVVPAVDPLLAQIIAILGHLFFYAIFYLFASAAVRQSCTSDRRLALISGLTMVFLYGVFDEYHQSFIPKRDASAMDIGLDLLGGIIAAGISAKEA